MYSNHGTEYLDSESVLYIYRVKFENGGRAQFEQMVSDIPQFVGRSTKADIVLAEDSVSRRHAKLYVIGQALYIEDLGSSNGIIVNGERILKQELSASDVVQIGSYTMRVEVLNGTDHKKFSRRTEIEHGEVAPIHEELVDNDQSSVSFLYRVSQCLCTHRQLNPLITAVLDAVMESLPAMRGFALARRDPKESLKLLATNIRQKEDQGPPISHTLIDHVLRTKASVLTTDASQDERFEDSASIAEFQIKAVICVPLSGQDEVYGVLYVDADSAPAPLTQKHLQVLSIVGQIVGAGIENIVLNENRIRQERLAGIGQAVSGTSHDMRNIMVGISGGAEIVEIACNDNNLQQARVGVHILRKTLDRFKALTDSLLTYARVSELKLESIDPGELIQEVLNTVEEDAKKRSIRMRYAPHGSGYISMDSQQMHRVLLNLVRNAMDAMEGRDGPIEIETGSEGGAAYIRVKDTGVGIMPEHIEKVGQPFFTTKQENGTGLGLAICYRIMEQHRGKIELDSTPGEGTTFTLKFPPDHSETRNDILTPG